MMELVRVRDKQCLYIDASRRVDQRREFSTKKPKYYRPAAKSVYTSLLRHTILILYSMISRYCRTLFPFIKAPAAKSMILLRLFGRRLDDCDALEGRR